MSHVKCYHQELYIMFDKPNMYTEREEKKPSAPD